MADIVLATLNARYTHAALGLRYLLANLKHLRPRAQVLEFNISQRPIDLAEAILAHRPNILALGVYIWNVQPTTELVRLLKAIDPRLRIVLGGPEVSYAFDQPIVQHADHVIAGEGDLAFAELAGRLLSGETPDRIITARPPDLAQVSLPYDLYTDQDIAHRVIYVEASRGCPFHCEFCLSSLDVPLRQFPLEQFLASMDQLIARGARQFKFVDRTFNLNLPTSKAILEFFLARYQPGMFLHLEMIPDRLPEPLRELIARFPPGAMQLELGIQTFNEAAAQRISRHQDNAKAEENLRFLRQYTGCHVHADLIVGLPGESLESFAAGFDRLVGLAPQEIQVGILKRLHGAPIARHDEPWRMVYSPLPPYEILSNSLIDFATMQRLRRFARYWDLVANSGNFRTTLPLLWRDASPFDRFLRFSDWLFATAQRTHAVALQQLSQWLFTYLCQHGIAPAEAAERMWADFVHCGRTDKPDFLAPLLRHLRLPSAAGPDRSLPRRQRRHQQ